MTQYTDVEPTPPMTRREKLDYWLLLVTLLILLGFVMHYGHD